MIIPIQMLRLAPGLTTHVLPCPPPSTAACSPSALLLLQFNARSESVAEKPAFRRLVPSRRCLVRLRGVGSHKLWCPDVHLPIRMHLQPGMRRLCYESSGTQLL